MFDASGALRVRRTEDRTRCANLVPLPERPGVTSSYWENSLNLTYDTRRLSAGQTERLPAGPLRPTIETKAWVGNATSDEYGSHFNQAKPYRNAKALLLERLRMPEAEEPAAKPVATGRRLRHSETLAEVPPPDFDWVPRIGGERPNDGVSGIGRRPRLSERVEWYR